MAALGKFLSYTQISDLSQPIDVLSHLTPVETAIRPQVLIALTKEKRTQAPKFIYAKGQGAGGREQGETRETRETISIEFCSLLLFPAGRSAN
ncbi:MAG: hypothetical protein ACRAVC_22955 [Trichormus sp.]